MSKEAFLNLLEGVEKYASASKFYRFSKTPGKYLVGLSYKEIFRKTFRRSTRVKTKTFWQAPIDVILPASMDIYLAGGKTHDSEIRLSKFLINNLSEGDEFLDVGANIGFFSLLAAALVKKSGKVTAIEASPQTFSLLQSNVKPYSNISPLNLALSEVNANLEFFEFPILYSEFNTLERDQYQHESWFKRIKPTVVTIPAYTGSHIIQNNLLHPQIIKIDVEGAEEKVIRGLLDFLETNSPAVVMEFAHPERGNANHIKAEQHLLKLGFSAYKINQRGALESLPNGANSYVLDSGLESDNIVYRRK